MKLTASKVKAISKNGRYGDGAGLFLSVRGESKTWTLRATIEGKRREIGVGPYPVLSLAQARIKAAELRLKILSGENPLAAKVKESLPTFREAAERAFEAISPRWKNAKVAANWKQRLERHVMPHLADLRVDEIGREQVLKVLSPIWSTKPETARKVRRYMRQTFSWCMAHGFIEHSPAGEVIDGALPPMPSVKANYRALPFAEVGAALETIRESRATASARLCFEFVVLTACRSGEARLAQWGEIDLDARTWRIPPERTKNGREHRQPLSDQAVAVLTKARVLHDGDLIFPSPKDASAALSNMTLTKILRDNGLADRAVVHGFRSSFRSWASECTSADFATCELCLGHHIGSAVERAYRRSDLYEKRARLLQQWANYLSGAERSKVIPIRA